jgi:serine phosphatase RsbU (regulator of sigma subunit)
VKNAPPPLARRLWRCTWLNVLFTLAAALVTYLHLDAGLLPAAAAQTVVSAGLVLAWAAAIRFLLSDTWGRWFWLVWLAGTALLVSQAGALGMGLGLALSGFFLTMRQYQPYRHISDRRRAAAFGLGLVAVALLIFAKRYWVLPEAGDQPLKGLRYLGGWSLWSLLGFWFWSLFHLAIRMRLHFLRLRPKLAVSAVLIGFVPLVLGVILSLVVFYAGLGGARGQRAANLLEGWRRMADRGADLSGAPFDTTFTWALDPQLALPEGQPSPSYPGTVIPAPGWTENLARSLASDLRVNRAVARADTAREGHAGPMANIRPDTTAWYLMEKNIWLMHWQDVGTPRVRTRAWLLGQQPLTGLSEVLSAGVDLTPSGARDQNGDLVLAPADDDLRRSFPGRRVSYRDVSDDPTFWNKFRYFGGTFFQVNTLRGGGLDQVSVFVNLRVRWQDLRREFVEGEENINLAVVVAIAIIAGLFFIIEVFALFFGVRITEGFVSAVHELDRGTRRLAAGDLDTVIDIPNEDELGDLAASFNAMTRAIRQGREDALANERLTRELETARAIQERLLPSDEPVLAGFEVTGASIPSREIGGDYFDFLVQDSDHIGIAIGDVSGKGMPAALLMSNLQASLQGQVIHPSTVAEVVTRVNDLIVRSTDPHMFATFFYGLLDTAAGTFTSTNAGHNPPVVLRADGEVQLLKTGGLLLGMVPEVVYAQETTVLQPGEIVVLYTDGITEAVGPSAEEDDPEAMFGEPALLEVIRRNRHLPAVGIKEAILDAVSQHTQGAAQSDDITLVVIRRQG